MDCEWIETCPFFAKDDMDSKSIKMLKEAFCHGHSENCARHVVLKAVGREFVPSGLYPNQTHLVSSIVKKAIKSGIT